MVCGSEVSMENAKVHAVVRAVAGGRRAASSVVCVIATVSDGVPAEYMPR